jgi:hypothetical protein
MTLLKDYDLADKITLLAIQKKSNNRILFINISSNSFNRFKHNIYNTN